MPLTAMEESKQTTCATGARAIAEGLTLCSCPESSAVESQLANVLTAYIHTGMRILEAGRNCAMIDMVGSNDSSLSAVDNWNEALRVYGVSSRSLCNALLRCGPSCKHECPFSMLDSVTDEGGAATELKMVMSNTVHGILRLLFEDTA
jgi:hypothetical protein